jgi:ubiquinone/menaquinone biosynthesis C-methylase UbiE
MTQRVTANKSAKEIAFLQDLFVAPNWGERFAELIDDHVTLPEKGRALYLAVGTGGHALALQERVGAELRFLCIDENEECLELARAKTTALKESTEFRHGTLDALQLRTDQFDLVLGDGSLVAPERVPAMLSEMVRVAMPDGTVALSLPTFSSFSEFFSIYWEALHNSGASDHETDVESLITKLPTVSEVEEMATREGLEAVSSWTRIEEFDYDSAEAFLDSPLISDFLMKSWLQSIPEEAQQRVTREIARLINEERHNAEFSLTVKATLVAGRKPRSPLAG